MTGAKEDHGKSSRLQKLLQLIEGGSSEEVRCAAAREVVHVTRAHPAQLPAVIRKVHGCLYHKQWESRVAAGEALGLLAEAFPQHNVGDLVAAAPGAAASQPQPAMSAALQNFNPRALLDRGTPLLASGGQEYDLVQEPGLTAKQRLLKQKEALKRRLGLDSVPEGVMDTDELVADEDLEQALQPGPAAARGGSVAGSAPVVKQAAADVLLGMEGLSARERNRLKRKAKSMARTDSLRSQDSLGPARLGGASRSLSLLGADSSAVGVGGAGSGSGSGVVAAGCGELSFEEEWSEVCGGAWPMQWAADQMLLDLLDPRWEVRHGAAVGLREVLRVGARCVGFSAPVDDEAASGWMLPAGDPDTPPRLRTLASTVSADVAAAATAANRSWLEECVLLLLCVLALDQFADYGSDQVTAPVRETAAQALAVCVCPGTPLPTLQHVIGLLENLQTQREWAVRYGGYLGIKYIMASRLDQATWLLPRQLPLLTAGLQDADDDVCAASAAALLPVVPELRAAALSGASAPVGSDAAAHIASLIWDQLLHLDTLSPASAGCLALLAQLLGGGGGDGHVSSSFAGQAAVSHAAPGSAAAFVSQPLHNISELVPRLWPYTSHTLTTVRHSAALCLLCLLEGEAACWRGGGGTEGGGGWVAAVGQPLLRHVFQRLLMEGDEKLQARWLSVWRAAIAALQPARTNSPLQPLPALAVHTPFDNHIQPPGPAAPAEGRKPLLAALMALAATPAGLPLPSEYLLSVAGSGHVNSDRGIVGAAAGAPASKRRRSPPPAAVNTTATAAVGAAAGSSSGLGFVVGAAGGPGEAVRMRLLAAEALAALMAALTEQDAGSQVRILLCECLGSPSATMRQLACLTLWSWMGQHASSGNPGTTGNPATTPAHSGVPVSQDPTTISQALWADAELSAALQAQLAAASPCQPLLPGCTAPYMEARPHYVQLRREVLSLVAACMQAGWLLHTPGELPVEALSSDHVAAMLGQVPASSGPAVAGAHQRVAGLLAGLQTFEQYAHMCTLAACGAAVVRSRALPAKLNSLLQPLMAALRKEPEPQLQAVCARAVAELLLLCASRTPSPNDKLLRNLCAMAWSDPAEVPPVVPPATGTTATTSTSAAAAATAAVAASGGGSATEPDAAALEAAAAALSALDGSGVAAAAAAAAATPEAQAARVARLGGEAALVAACEVFGDQLWTRLPALWQILSAPLATADAVAAAVGAAPSDPAVVAAGQSLVGALRVLQVVGPRLHESLVPSLEPLLPQVLACTGSSNSAVQLSGAGCAAALLAARLPRLMPALLRLLLPRFSPPHPPASRLGAVAVVSQLSAAAGPRALAPYVVLLIVPLLRCMADASGPVRASAAACFGSLVALVPLAQGAPLPPGLDDAQLQSARQDSEFLVQLLDGKRATSFPLPVSPRVVLRPYQQEGVNWLAFLRRFGLHGVLADDMGLGKTLQASCIMAAALVEEEAAHRQQQEQQQRLTQQALIQTQVKLEQQATKPAIKQEQQQQEIKPEQQQGAHSMKLEEVKEGAAASALPVAGEASTVGKSSHVSQPISQPNMQRRPNPACLVVCPSTLVQHWVHEIQRCMDTSALRPVAYCGNPGERASLRKTLDAAFDAPLPAALSAAQGGTEPGHDGNAGGDAAAAVVGADASSCVAPKPVGQNKHSGAGSQQYGPPNVVVMSYEHLRADVEWVAGREWLYAVLDEGHVIKGHKTRVAQACRRIAARHRLILSGTPIQNSVLELWSLFDFLMPGLLGSERAFNARFGKAVRAGARAATTKRGGGGGASAEAEAGLLAAAALHRAVQPFILRRTKAQVLADLPPKIIQDVVCDLSPLQAALYEDFQASQASQEAAAALARGVVATSEGGGGGGGARHVFQSLHYLRRLCSHPALVLDLAVPQHAAAAARLLAPQGQQQQPQQALSESAVQAALRDVSHAPKLVALRELLAQCGILRDVGNGGGGEGSGGGSEEIDVGGGGGGAAAASHRVLVFAQMKGMLDLVERDVLQPAGVSFLRLDGGVDPSQRFGIVQRFNSDPTIDVLLLTTAVGGLGLNLTSADIVIFLEHDWNPAKDLQAMDRAHRLGQRRTVHVYRLLMRDTLEERVLGLQAFKLDVASAVVNADNVSMADMDTGALLDLFGNTSAGPGSAAGSGTSGAAGGGGGSGLQAVLASMGEMWDEAQYATQFDTAAFARKLGTASDRQLQRSDP